jgi:hypothetical protein
MFCFTSREVWAKRDAFISVDMSSGTINDIVVHIVTPEPKLLETSINR